MNVIIHKQKEHEKRKQKKHRWKETIAVRKELCTPKDVKYVKSIKRQRTSPIHPNVFSLGEELALEQIQKGLCLKKIRNTPLCTVEHIKTPQDWKKKPSQIDTFKSMHQCIHAHHLFHTYLSMHAPYLSCILVLEHANNTSFENLRTYNSVSISILSPMKRLHNVSRYNTHYITEAIIPKL